MPQPALLAERPSDLDEPCRAESRMIDTMRELVRSGYVVDPDAEGEDLLLRHKVAPDLWLDADGSLALALSQPKKRRWRLSRRAGSRQIHWRRVVGVSLVALVAWSASVMLGVALLSA